MTSGFSKILKYFDFLMVIIYLTLGMILIFTGEIFAVLNRNARLIFGVLLVVYAAFRAYRAIRIIRNEKSF